MGTLIFRWRHLALISTLIALLLSAVACGGDANEEAAASDSNPVAAAATSTAVPLPPTATAAPTATNLPEPTATNVPEPTATFVVVQVTPAPIPTETPIPTPTPVPPTPEPVVDLKALNDVGPQRPFPDSLLKTSERLERAEAVAIWDAFLSDSRIIGELDGPNVLDLCSDHTGRWVHGSQVEISPLTGMTFEWEIKSSPAGSWNQPHLVMTSDEFASLTYGAHLIHRASDGTVYTVLYPVGGYRPVTEGYEQPSIFTLNSNDFSYEFSETTDTMCAR